MYKFHILFYPVILLWAFRPQQRNKEQLIWIKRAKKLRNEKTSREGWTQLAGLQIWQLSEVRCSLLSPCCINQPSFCIPITAVYAPCLCLYAKPAGYLVLPSGQKEVSCHSRLRDLFTILTLLDPLSPFHTGHRYTLSCYSPWIYWQNQSWGEVIGMI